MTTTMSSSVFTSAYMTGELLQLQAAAVVRHVKWYPAHPCQGCPGWRQLISPVQTKLGLLSLFSTLSE